MTDDRSTVYEFAGGAPAFLALATALNDRCLEDPVLNHPFSHPGHPQRLERLAGYLGEVFGGPPVYSQMCGGHSAMLLIRSEEHTSELQSLRHLVCRLLLEKNK